LSGAGYGVIAIWWIVRSIKGFQHLDKKQPYPNYQSWAF
jgi:uncharacterized membrane protein